MHELARYVQGLMDQAGWRQADLARASGVSKEVVSNLLDKRRDGMTRPPAPETIAGIARAFPGRTNEQMLWLRVAQSMGLPVGTEVTVPDPDALTDQQLLDVLARRLAARSATDDEPSATITAIDERRARPPAEKRAARRPKDGPAQPIS